MAITAECEIFKLDKDMSSCVVVEGEEFRNYTPQERMEKVEKIPVMARSTPSDKPLMVQCLKQKGQVVAVTGDCTNDAQSSRKQISVYPWEFKELKLRKRFLLTVNVAALRINFIAAMSAGEVPPSTVQILLGNLYMNKLAALSIVTERPTKELMAKPPISRTELLIPNIMWRKVLAQALYQMAPYNSMVNQSLG
ncbi:hypothetical protein J1N35_016593 [Gossypium stocksii]|uniref:Cation-transporting P-type ATPase C-terminal domain-containing protein n=1 Tax=Gossypium stocksii TaxID=47602 RepID=A0A9D4A5E2_9ROSI|nr:hypothetical protein J1N35_016593 [Gossypium stocksii]